MPRFKPGSRDNPVRWEASPEGLFLKSFINVKKKKGLTGKALRDAAYKQISRADICELLNRPDLLERDDEGQFKIDNRLIQRGDKGTRPGKYETEHPDKASKFSPYYPLAKQVDETKDRFRASEIRNRLIPIVKKENDLLYDEDDDVEENNEDEKDEEGLAETTIIHIGRNKSMIETFITEDYSDPIPSVEISIYGVKITNRNDRAELMERAEALFDLVLEILKA